MPEDENYEERIRRVNSLFNGWGPRKDQEATSARDRLLAEGKAVEDADVIAEMRMNRRINRTASTSGGSVSSPISFATGRPRDPMFYWRENNLPFDIHKDEELVKIRDFCRLLYISHPVIPSVIDIYSQWPVVDLRLECKDQQLVDFYGDLFFDQLEYEDFLVDVGREFWTVGEAFALGSFNDTLGVWESDELINPNDVKVIRSPFLKDPRFEMKVPEVIRTILLERNPQWEYEQLLRAYPELAHFSREDSMMPVSNVLLKHLRFKGDPYHPRGLPILMRCFRAIIQEEMLNAAQDSIAERLYTPLLIAKLGASATDLGVDTPWIPTDYQRETFLDALDAALAADFRILVTHFATDISSAFGRETLPDFNPDYDRITDKQLQVFGLSRSMLTGADEGQTYAADALNRDLVTQLLTHDQRRRLNLMKQRMLVVAEAQEHFDYEERGGKKYPIMEEILEIDEDGKERIVERPKLLVPTLKARSMSLTDQENERQFLEALRGAGVPISMKRRTITVPNYEWEDEVEKVAEEQTELAVANEKARRDTYRALRNENLPIPEDLQKDFQPTAQTAQGYGTDTVSGEVPMPSIGEDQPAPTVGLVPTDEDYAEAEGDESAPSDEEVANYGAVPTRNRMRPPESDEMREDMPKAASLEEIEAGEIHEGRLQRGPFDPRARRRHLDPDVPLDEQGPAE